MASALMVLLLTHSVNTCFQVLLSVRSLSVRRRATCGVTNSEIYYSVALRGEVGDMNECQSMI